MSQSDHSDTRSADADVPVVLVHGNPETPAVWSLVAELLDRTDVSTPNLPGFGCPTPTGFTATKEAYVDWLIAEIESIGRPVHLVGHDWGGALTVRVAEMRPDLLVSWCSDAVGLFHPSYVWHDLAQVWQTPGDGEANVEAMAAVEPADGIALFEALGIPTVQATAFIEAFDATMGASVLALYRSAVPELMAPWMASIGDAASQPGLAVRATDDPYVGNSQLVTEAAEAAGATVATLEGLGHWWMLQDPALAAATLTIWFAQHEG